MGLKDQYAVLKYSHVGLTFAIILGGSFFLGMKADQKFGTGSVLTLLGGGLGTALGFYNLLREVASLERRGQAEETPSTAENEESGSQPPPEASADDQTGRA